MRRCTRRLLVKMLLPALSRMPQATILVQICPLKAFPEAAVGGLPDRRYGLFSRRGTSYIQDKTWPVGFHALRLCNTCGPCGSLGVDHPRASGSQWHWFMNGSCGSNTVLGKQVRREWT